MHLSAERRSGLYQQFERATALPMLVLSLVFLGVIAVPLLTPLNASMQVAFARLDWVIWAAFALELSVKAFLAPSALHYLRTHWYDVVIVAVPFLRPLRVVRSIRLLRELSLLRLGSVGLEISSSARAILREHGLQYALLVGGLIVLACAEAETIFERAAGGSIADFGTGIWWAMTTVTTGGSASLDPVTPEGRGIAMFLRLVGVALFSFLTANIAAFLVGSGRKERDPVTLDDVMMKLQEMEEQIAASQKGDFTGA
jgi:voltage-gated potassium channel